MEVDDSYSLRISATFHQCFQLSGQQLTKVPPRAHADRFVNPLDEERGESALCIQRRLSKSGWETKGLE
jgi:hypothetical protein